MKSNIKTLLMLSMLSMPVALTGCYDDKGNYDYTEEEEITVEFPEQIACMEGGEYIEFDPVVTSSIKGEIAEGDPDYDFCCKIMFDNYDEEGKKLKWYNIDSLGTKAISFRAMFPAATYPLWYTVTNRNTGIVHSFESSVKIINSTSNGWIVLSNCGPEKIGRMDMIFKNAKNEELVYPDIKGENHPDVRDMRQIFVDATKDGSIGTQIWLSSGTGTWLLNNTTLCTDDSYNIKMLKFVSLTQPGEVVWWHPVEYDSHGHYSSVCITSEGNAYGIYQYIGNASYEDPMNTDAPGNAPTYKVAPVAASSEVRPGNSDHALFYDITNKRFMAFQFTNSYGDSEILHPLVHDTESGPQKFNYTTGMDFVHMEGTRFSDGVVYTILQDASGRRHIFGIVVGLKCQQESYYSDITAENFNNATDYAFHSQYPYVCYCYGNKVYSYNYVTREVADVVTLDGEQTTMVKFPLFKMCNIGNLMDRTDELVNKQFQLVVGSSTGGTDSGIIRFYEVASTGKLTEVVKYTGLGEQPVDIAYRERIK